MGHGRDRRDGWRSEGELAAGTERFTMTRPPVAHHESVSVGVYGVYFI
jgi:hypothetical protein